MKINKSLIIAAVIALTVWLFWKNSKKATSEKNAAPPPDVKVEEGDKDAEVITQSSQKGQAYIEGRVKELEQSNVGENYATEFAENIVSGVRSIPAMSSILIGLEVEMSDKYLNAWKQVQNQKDFESLMRNVRNFNRVAGMWNTTVNPLRKYDVDLWPANVKDIVAAYYLDASGNADKDWSEKYAAYTLDLKKVASNVPSAYQKFYNALRAQALQDLRDAGLNIV